MVEDGTLDLAALMAQLQEPLRLVDVGCRWGFSDAWAALGSNVDLLGFDPDADECERLATAWRGPGRGRFVPLALGERSSKAKLHLTEVPACSSVFAPVPGIWNVHPELECVRPTGEREIDICALDSWRGDGSSPIDVMKLDVQGAELAVLRGATETIRHVRAIELEVSFAEIYTGQALFPEVDTFLRSAGFVLWRLHRLAHYGRRGEPNVAVTTQANFHDSVSVRVDIGAGQLFWAEAVYVSAASLGPRRWEDGIRDAAAFAAVGLPDRAVASVARALEAGPAALAELLTFESAPPLPAGSSDRRRLRRWTGLG